MYMFFFVVFCIVPKSAIKSLETNKELPKANISKRNRQKALGILLQNESVGFAWNKIQCGIGDGSFWFRRSKCIFLWWNKTWASMSKWKQVQGSLYSFFRGKCEESNHHIIKKLTKDLKHLLWPKKHASTRRHGRINTNGCGLMERKSKCSARFVENSRIGKTCNTPWGFGHVETQTMQTADCRLCRLSVIFLLVP